MCACADCAILIAIVCLYCNQASNLASSVQTGNDEKEWEMIDHDCCYEKDAETSKSVIIIINGCTLFNETGVALQLSSHSCSY